MKQTLEQFVKEHELAVLAEHEQELLEEFGGADAMDNGFNHRCSRNNCHAKNCAGGCGKKKK